MKTTAELIAVAREEGHPGKHHTCQLIWDLADALERATEGDPDFRAIAVERDNDLTQATAELAATRALCAEAAVMLRKLRNHETTGCADCYSAGRGLCPFLSLVARLEARK